MDMRHLSWCSLFFFCLNQSYSSSLINDFTSPHPLDIHGFLFLFAKSVYSVGLCIVGIGILFFVYITVYKKKRNSAY